VYNIHAIVLTEQLRDNMFAVTAAPDTKFHTGVYLKEVILRQSQKAECILIFPFQADLMDALSETRVTLGTTEDGVTPRPVRAYVVIVRKIIPNEGDTRELATSVVICKSDDNVNQLCVSGTFELINICKDANERAKWLEEIRKDQAKNVGLLETINQ